MINPRVNKSLDSSFFNNTESRDLTSSNIQENDAQGKLPNIKIKKILRKIGSVQREKGSFVPTQQDRNQFRKTKLAELKRQYSLKKPNRKIIPYQDEDFDEIVLDCWTHGEKNGRKTVWRKYRQRYDELTFHTMKLAKKRRLMV